MNITPNMINWREGLVFGIRKTIIDYPRLNGPQRIGAGKKRRFLRFTITCRDAQSILNELHSEINGEHTVVLPIFPIRTISRSTTNYQGRTKLYVKGDIYRRPLTVYSNLENEWPNSIYVGYETLMLCNMENWDLEEVSVLKAGAYIGGVEYASNGQTIPNSVIELTAPIVMSVQEKNLVICNFFKGRIVDEIESDFITGKASETEIEFEEVFEGEMA